MWKFWLAWTIDAVVAAIVLFFLAGFFFLALIVSHPRWN